MRLRHTGRGLAPAVAALAAVALIPAPAAAAACPGESDPVSALNIAQSEAAMHCLVNDYRVSHGALPVLIESHLAAAARAHAQDMVARSFFSHVNLAGFSPRDRAVAAGYAGGGGIGENIVSGAATPRALFDVLVGSAPHAGNMLGPQWKVAGVGIEAGAPFSGFGATAVQMFGENTGGGNPVDVAIPESGSGGTTTGTHACEKVTRLRIKLAHRKAQKASTNRIAKTKAKLKKAKAACRAGQAA
jgi:uncharacterized protein YkwD